jgi:hypothetical protein
LVQDNPNDMHLFPSHLVSQAINHKFHHNPTPYLIFTPSPTPYLIFDPVPHPLSQWLPQNFRPKANKRKTAYELRVPRLADILKHE